MEPSHELENIKPELEIDEHLDSQKKGFRIQKLGMAFIFGVVLLAAVGVFGDGLASKKTVTASNARIEFEQYYRFEARMQVKVELKNVKPNEATISFSNEYLKDFRIESINPEVNETRIINNFSHFVFDGSGDMNITFHFVPQKVGKVKGSMLIGDQSFSIHHFIYP